MNILVKQLNHLDFVANISIILETANNLEEKFKFFFRIVTLCNVYAFFARSFDDKLRKQAS